METGARIVHQNESISLNSAKFLIRSRFVLVRKDMLFAYLAWTPAFAVGRRADPDELVAWRQQCAAVFP